MGVERNENSEPSLMCQDCTAESYISVILSYEIAIGVLSADLSAQARHRQLLSSWS